MKNKLIYIHLLNLAQLLVLVLFVNTALRWMSLTHLGILHLLIALTVITGLKLTFFNYLTKIDPFTKNGWPRTLYYISLGVLCIAMILRVIHWPGAFMTILVSLGIFTIAFVVSFTGISDQKEISNELLDNDF